MLNQTARSGDLQEEIWQPQRQEVSGTARKVTPLSPPKEGTLYA